MALEIPQVAEDPRKLTQSVIQVVDMLDLYHAELARILHLQCQDIGRLAHGQSLLQPGTKAWHQAKGLVRFYQLLYQKLGANGVSMRNWLRREHAAFRKTPHLMLVDEDRLTDLLDYLTSTR